MMWHGIQASVNVIRVHTAMGSPGMGNRVVPYDVLLLMEDGQSEVFEHITGAEL